MHGATIKMDDQVFDSRKFHKNIYLRKASRQPLGVFLHGNKLAGT